MEAKALTSKEIFDNKIFFVPQYQRYYDWDERQCIELLDNVWDLFVKFVISKKKHFIGNIVVKKNIHEEYELIDGQQRLTTLILIAKILTNKFEELDYDRDNKNYLNLRNVFLEGDEKIRLTLRNEAKDQLTFLKIINGDFSFIDKSSNLYKNYDAIDKYINNIMLFETFDLELFSNLFLELDLVLIELNSGDDNSQNVFESLNSKGKELHLFDLVKNYVFMNIEDHSTQENLYNTYWTTIEQNLTLKQMKNFIRFFILINQNSIDREYVGTDDKKVYYQFKKTFYDLKDRKKVTAFLEKLYKWHFLYMCTIVLPENYTKIKDSLKVMTNSKKYIKILDASLLLLTLNDSDLMPLIYLYLANLTIEKKITVENYRKSIKLMESYYVRWFVSSGLGNLIDPLTEFMNKIDKELESQDDLSNFNGIISQISRKATYTQFRYQNNDDVRNSLISKSVKSQKRDSLLRMAERALSRQNTIFDTTLNKEHILPNTYAAAIKSGWYNDEEVAQAQHDANKSFIGNFIIVDKKLNGKLSSCKIDEKIKIMKSAIKDNSYIKTRMMEKFINFYQNEGLDKWTVTEMKLWNEKVLIPNILNYINEEDFY